MAIIFNNDLTATVGITEVPFKFEYDSSTGKYGYRDGADTFCPFNGGGGIDPTKLVISQDEFIQICNKGLQSQMSIGAIVQLNNQYGWQYEVIDINHDGTTGTVDLMAHTQVGNMKFGSSSRNYSTSIVRTWLNDTYISAFDSGIQSLMKTMQVTTSGTTVNDKVKLLSWKELGVTYNSGYMDNTDGGTQYPCFTAGTYGTVTLDRWRTPGIYGNTNGYWTRSIRYDSSNNLWRVTNSCTMSGDGNSAYNNRLGVLPVMRF